MKEISKQFLEESLLSMQFHSPGDIYELFKFYSAIEIENQDNIVNASVEFFEYLKAVKKYLPDKQTKCAIDSSFSRILSRLRSFDSPNEQLNFSNIVLNLSPVNPVNANILDVGPSRYAFSSLYMAKTAKHLTAMDHDFIFAIESLKNMNVNAIENYFDENTSVEDYDFVVGKCPCSAIVYMIKNCVKSNKPYFIELCDCSIPNINKLIQDNKISTRLDAWKYVLPEIDPKVKFFDEYAFNLDASPEQVKTIIEKFQKKIQLSTRFKNSPSSIKLERIFVPNEVTGFEWE